MLSTRALRPDKTNPNWLKGFAPDEYYEDGDWVDMHDQLLELMTFSSDKAMAYRRNLYAHLNAARYAGIALCLQIVKANDGNQTGMVVQLQTLLEEITSPPAPEAETDGN